MKSIFSVVFIIKKIILSFIVFPAFVVAQDRVRFATPPPSPTLFADGSINTALNERDFALSPDGTEIFYTLQSPMGLFQTIVHLKKNTNGIWSKPAIASFSGAYGDLEPAFASDGKTLYFSSNRHRNGDTARKDFDIWMVEKENGVWGSPRNLGSPVNTEANEYYPSVADNGNLYYTAAYKNSKGREDIYLARWENGKFFDPMPLDSSVNSERDEFNAFVSPDEQFIIFSSYGRKDDRDGGDLYISRKDGLGHWQPAKNMMMLNSEKLDYCPFVSFDRKILFFTSNRHALGSSYNSSTPAYEELVRDYTQLLNGSGNIYWVSFDSVRRMYQ